MLISIRPMLLSSQTNESRAETQETNPDRPSHRRPPEGRMAVQGPVLEAKFRCKMRKGANITGDFLFLKGKIKRLPAFRPPLHRGGI
jgi:hypothetical protein